MQKKFFLQTYLPYFFSDRYRKQTIYFFRPNAIIHSDVILDKQIWFNPNLRINFKKKWMDHGIRTPGAAVDALVAGKSQGISWISNQI